MYTPRSDQSMISGAERPVELNPYRQTRDELDEMAALMAREIEELREILSKPRQPRRHRDD